MKGKDGTMTRIRVDDLHRDWMKDSKYHREYEALEEEFSLVAALIEARTRAGLTQEEVAHRMKTTQAMIARLESGGSKPSTRTREAFRLGHRWEFGSGWLLKTAAFRRTQNPWDFRRW